MKNIKIISFEIIAFISLFLSFEFFKKSSFEITYLLGVILLYLGTYILVEVFQKILKVKTENNLIPFLLKIIVPFYTLKIIDKELYKKNIYFILGILFSIIIISILEYKYKKKYYTKKILTFENLENICIVFFPFYFLKTGSIKIIYILIFLFLRKIYIEKRIEIKKETKIIYIILLLFIVVLIITSFINPIGHKGIGALKNIFFWIFYLFIFLQFINSKIDYNNIFLITIISVNIFYIPIFIHWQELNYKFKGIRLGGFIDITQTGVILGLLSILYLFYICYKKEILLIPYLIMNFIFLLLTGSKGPLLLVIFFSLIILFLYLKIKTIVYFMSSILIILILFSNDLTFVKRIKNDDGSSAARKLVYKESFQQFLNRPILGNGHGTYLEIAKERHKKELVEAIEIKNKTSKEVGIMEAYGRLWYTHSNPLELLRGSGIFSFIFYYSFVSYIIFLFLNFYKKTKDKIYYIALICFLYFEIYGIIDNVIIYERLQLINMYIVFLNILYYYNNLNSKKDMS